jgi:DNA-binding GntR family transcriptional regulator
MGTTVRCLLQQVNKQAATCSKKPTSEYHRAMALKLSKQSLVRTAPKAPLRDQLADHIRQAIIGGDLRPGEQLESEHKIAAAVGVDRSTVRFALGILADEGLILRSQGKPTIVAPTAPMRRETIHFPEDEWRDAEEVARRRGESLHGVIRAALRRYIKRHQR